ncbi:hypothetical protein ACXYX3_06775 [Mycobacterium sp. C3-094]
MTTQQDAVQRVPLHTREPIDDRLVDVGQGIRQPGEGQRHLARSSSGEQHSETASRRHVARVQGERRLPDAGFAVDDQSDWTGRGSVQQDAEGLRFGLL